MTRSVESDGFSPETFEPVLFSFGPGAGQDSAVYRRRFIPRLEKIAKDNKLPVRALTFDYPWMDPDATFDDIAEFRMDIEQNERKEGERLFRVGWSRDGNVAERYNDYVDHAIHVASAFNYETIRRPRSDLDANMPVAKTDDYEDALIDSHKEPTLPEGITRFDPEKSKKVFYNFCRPVDQEWAAERIRPRRQRRMAEPRNPFWRYDLERDYIVCTGDNAIPPEWQVYVATNWLHVKPLFIDADHTPWLSRYERIAYMLLSIANQE